MNAIGIDYGRARSVIALREGPVAQACTLLDDGRSRLVPHAVLGAHWGSRALERGVAPPWADDADLPGPWVMHPEAVGFWKALHSHIRDYLGGVPPGRRHGYEVVVCTEAESPSHAEAAVTPIIREAGWGDVDWVPPTHALLCSWLLEGHRIQGLTKVGVVACGDTTTRVGAYLVDTRSRQLEIAEAYIAAQPLLTGYSVWERTVRQMVLDHLIIPDTGVPREWDLSLHREMPHFATKLARGGSCKWPGLLQAHMFSEFSVARRDWIVWPTVATLRAELPALLEEALTQLSGAPASQVIVIGGVGALWPFCQDAVAILGPSLECHSRSPERGLASGAAGWPLLRSRFPEQHVPQDRIPADTVDFRESLPSARTPPADQESYQRLIRRIQAGPGQDG